MTLTMELVHELRRTLDALDTYMEEFDGANFHTLSNVHHAAAKRATLDVTRKLAEWRKHGSYQWNGIDWTVK